MQASVQYNDFYGTAAADISDHTSLEKFLKKKGVNTDKYKPIGAKFFSGYNEYFGMSIICTNSEKSAPNNIISIDFDELNKDDFFKLFKRFEVIILLQHSEYHDSEIEERLTVEEINSIDKED